MPGRTIDSAQAALASLKSYGSQENRQGMARFGIDTQYAYGVSMPQIRAVAKTIVRDHDLAERIWQTGIHEARILTAFVDKPQWVTGDQMDRWTADFNSWDLCDQICGNMWDRAPMRDEKIIAWAEDEREFVKRAAFATIAWRAVHDKTAEDSEFLIYLPMIGAAAYDDRNFVKKAVNWALRQIGKRSAELYLHAREQARELAGEESMAARWIGKDALREFEKPALRTKLGLK